MLQFHSTATKKMKPSASNLISPYRDPSYFMLSKKHGGEGVSFSTEQRTKSNHQQEQITQFISSIWSCNSKETDSSFIMLQTEVMHTEIYFEKYGQILTLICTPTLPGKSLIVPRIVVHTCLPCILLENTFTCIELDNILQ